MFANLATASDYRRLAASAPRGSWQRAAHIRCAQRVLAALAMHRKSF